MWKNERDILKRRFNRNLSLQEICNAGKKVISEFTDEDLRLIQCCSLPPSNSMHDEHVA